jgi:hypothetical protein
MHMVTPEQPTMTSSSKADDEVRDAATETVKSDSNFMKKYFVWDGSPPLCIALIIYRASRTLGERTGRLREQSS